MTVSDTISIATRIAMNACDQWDCITSPPQLFMHRENSVFKVGTTTGAAALRVHRHGYHDRQSVLSELKWMAHLAAHGLQVPAPMANLHGTYLADVDDDDKIYVVDLLTWLDGIPLGNSTEPLAFDKGELRTLFFNLGSGIAQMHTVTDAWAIPSDFKRHAWDRDGFVGDHAFWGAFWNVHDISDADRAILEKARLKAGVELDALRKAGADYGLIHADYMPQNILVSGGRIRIIDFDDSGFGFRMYDFATALVKNRDEPHYETIKASLFEGYRSRRRLSALDEKSLELFLTLRDLAYLGWMEDRRAEPGVEARMPRVRAAAISAAHAYVLAPSVV